MSTAAAIRPGRDDDAAGFIALVGDCWAEYPACVMDVDAEVPELRALASHYAAKGGALWCAERAGRVVGMVATRPLGDGAWELCKMYAAVSERGSGLASRLLALAEAQARAQGASGMKLWTDTRFTRAHGFYEKHSYLRAGPIRALHDLSNTVEFGYAKPLAGVVARQLDTAAAASAETRLSLVLRDCVEDGASVSFLPPLATRTARAFWHRTAAEVAAGRCLLFAAWLDGEVAGTVQVDLATPPNQPHRAEVKKLLIHPAARRRGVARRLMREAEAAAAAAGRSLLVLDTCEGSAAEALYGSLGWIETGRVANYALLPDGSLCTAVMFGKHLPIRPG